MANHEKEIQRINYHPECMVNQQDIRQITLLILVIFGQFNQISRELHKSSSTAAHITSTLYSQTLLRTSLHLHYNDQCLGCQAQLLVKSSGGCLEPNNTCIINMFHIIITINNCMDSSGHEPLKHIYEIGEKSPH